MLQTFLEAADSDVIICTLTNQQDKCLLEKIHSLYYSQIILAAKSRIINLQVVIVIDLLVPYVVI